MKNARDAAADYLMSRIDWEQAKSIPYVERTFPLGRMRRLLALLGNPQESFPIVHVAGTKGKGSTTAMLASVFHAAGFKTGAFTSPHLERIEERFAIDGRPCPGETFAELVELIRPAVEVVDREMPGDGPTYFEIATAVAFLYFARAKVDIAVLEVGLGGRFDSTNVCRPMVSVITSISYDHTAQLGTTLAQIAGEKAGIIKPGVAVVSGVLAPEAQEVIRRTCQERGSRLIEFGGDFHTVEPIVSDGACPRIENHVGASPTANYYNLFDYHDSDADYTDMRLGMLGVHQTRNAAVTIATIHELRRQGWTVDESAIRTGLATARCPARVELFDGSPKIVIDAAHNGASIEALVATLDGSISARQRHLLFATTLEKDFRAMLTPLVHAFDRIIFTRYTINPRSVDPIELFRLAEELVEEEKEESDEQARRLNVASLEVDVDPVRAFQWLRTEAGPDDLICVTGSFFIATEIRRLLVPPVDGEDAVR